MAKKKSLFTAYGTSKDVQETGAWIPMRADIRVRVRSTQSKAAKAAQARIGERNKRFVKIGVPVPDEVQLQNEIDIACAVTADWENVDIGDGAIPCTDENKRLIFEDDRLWEFRQLVVASAVQADNFREQDTEDDAKNSVSAALPKSD